MSPDSPGLLQLINVLLNVLIIPVLVSQVRLEHRLTKLEGLNRRIGLLERRAGFDTRDDTTNF